jgi:hypothetical protein
MSTTKRQSLHDSTQAEDSIFYQLLRKHPFDSVYQSASKGRFTICIPPDADVRYIVTTNNTTSKLLPFISTCAALHYSIYVY